MGHALGMWHTHQRPDRDDYVIIEWDNIAYGAEYNFDKLQIQITTDDAPYDYGSVMHYSTQLRADRTFSDDICMHMSNNKSIKNTPRLDASSYDTCDRGDPVISELDSLTAVTPPLGVRIQVGK